MARLWTGGPVRHPDVHNFLGAPTPLRGDGELVTDAAGLKISREKDTRCFSSCQLPTFIFYYFAVLKAGGRC